MYMHTAQYCRPHFYSIHVDLCLFSVVLSCCPYSRMALLVEALEGESYGVYIDVRSTDTIEYLKLKVIKRYIYMLL